MCTSVYNSDFYRIKGMTMNNWAVVGAGPAGIAAIGKLLDAGVQADDIVWIDPNFQVGDLGTLWRNVDSNTKVGLFTRFLDHCSAFQLDKSHYELFTLHPEDTCKLRFIADCLQTVTENLQRSIHTERASVERIEPYDGHWRIYLPTKQLEASNIILAIGAVPNAIENSPTQVIPLETALDAEKLKHDVNATDTVAVFGSSHSAIMIIRDCFAAGVKRVINFYRSPLRYAVYMDDWILFDNTGLKGLTAKWAKEHIQTHPHPGLERYYSNPENLEKYLPECTKAVYATGFSARSLPIDGMQGIPYSNKTGIIAPGLFGVGIAFPESKVDPVGNIESNVGLWKFMTYLDRVMPIWLKYTN